MSVRQSEYFANLSIGSYGRFVVADRIEGSQSISVRYHGFNSLKLKNEAIVPVSFDCPRTVPNSA